MNEQLWHDGPVNRYLLYAGFLSRLDVGAFDSGDDRVELICTADEVEMQMGGMYLRHAHKGGVDVPADQTSRNHPARQPWASGKVKQKTQFLSVDKKQRNIGQHAESPILAALKKIFTFLWAMVSILLILAALYTAFRIR